jgi:hypothetical protein
LYFTRADGLVAHAGRDDETRRDEGRALVDPRKERLEHARPALEHVDEVDAAGPRLVLAALHVDEGGDRMRAVGQQDVVVRRHEVQDDRRRDDEPDDGNCEPRRTEPCPH